MRFVVIKKWSPHRVSTRVVLGSSYTTIPSFFPNHSCRGFKVPFHSLISIFLFLCPRVQSGRRNPGRSQISHVDFRIRILKDPEVEVVTPQGEFTALRSVLTSPVVV